MLLKRLLTYSNMRDMNNINIPVTVNGSGKVKEVSLKVFDYLFNKGKIKGITVYEGDDTDNEIVSTEWFVYSVIS